MSLPGGDVEKYKLEVERCKQEKAGIMADAKKLETKSLDWDKQSDAQMHQHYRWAQAMTAEQIAISLAAITLLTRKKCLNMHPTALPAAALPWACLPGCISDLVPAFHS